MIGNAHLRPAGLWSFEAGKDEALATLRSATERCEEYPDFKFTFGDVWALQLVERMDKALFKRIRKLVKKGQWSIAQGTYSLSDPHLLSAAMWKRQVWIGHRFCRDYFGTQPQVAMNLEARSFPVATCQQLLDTGYQAMVYFSDDPSAGPAETSVFRWSNDHGKELLCYRLSPHYRTRSHELYGQILESVEAGSVALAHTLCFFGVGNHGGGPTKENIEYIRTHRDAFENVELKFSTLEEFFAHALLMSDSFPVHEGPIGSPSVDQLLNRHRQQRQQRKVETLLSRTEVLCDRMGDKASLREVDRQLDGVWSDLMEGANACLLHGSLCTEEVEAIDCMQLRAARFAREWLWTISRSWARKHLEPINYQQIVVMRGHDHSQDLWIEHEPNLDFDLWGRRKLCDLEGNLIPYDLLPSASGNPQMYRLLFRARLPENGVARYLLREFPDILVDAGGVENFEQKSQLRVLKTTMENGFWTLRVSPRSVSRITPIGDRECNLLGKLGMSLTLYEDSVDADCLGQRDGPQVYAAGIESDGWEVLEEGKLRVSMVNRGRIGQSPFEWHLQLCEGDPRIYHRLRIAFAETERHLELNLYLDQEVSQWLDATGAAAELRDASDATVPFHGWTQSRGSGPTIALISDDAFACRHQAQCLSLLLLRSPESALCHTGDLGVHEFHWVLWPDANLSETELQHELLQLQQPPVVFDAYEGLNRPAWENSTPLHLQGPNERRARADGQMQHLADGSEQPSAESRA